MKFRHADIPAALALVREQLEEEGKRLFAAGAKVLSGKVYFANPDYVVQRLLALFGVGKARVALRG